jgi:valyl-tRNA synthetase
MLCLPEGNPPAGYVQETDVLDTWFSSALWPFSTLGWPEQTEDLKRFYPNATLITGHDILFFWVARMLLMGAVAFDEPPFPEVFLHGLIYGKSYWRVTPTGGVTYVTAEEKQSFDRGKPTPSDVHSRWEKMSKSKGNVIDPMEMIALYGADALRLGLCASATTARQIDLDQRRFEEFKTFANKLWNGARFVLMKLEGAVEGPVQFALEERWILSRLHHTIYEVERQLTAYAFDKVVAAIYDFFWNEFCAYYVELVKQGSNKETKQRVLALVLSSVLRLLHPIAPFITEELFARLKAQYPSISTANACAIAPFPQSSDVPYDKEAETTFAFLSEVVHAIRHIRAEMQISPGTPNDLYLIGEGEASRCLQEQIHLIRALVKLGEVQVVRQPPAPIGHSARGRGHAVHPATC